MNWDNQLPIRTHYSEAVEHGTPACHVLSGGDAIDIPLRLGFAPAANYAPFL